MWQLLTAYGFILLLLGIVRLRKIDREKEILIASVRMTIQLVLVGYLLGFIFEQAHPGYTVVFLLAMLAFAVTNVYDRVKVSLSGTFKRLIGICLVSGTLVSLFFFILAVIRLSPWYNPRYFIPIAGMIIGNSMTGISLGVNHLIQGIAHQRATIEGALMLGASPRRAVKAIVDSSFDAAILPTINSMVGMGIVFLPGMMTGQILSGVSPVTAIRYQIAIMLGIVGSVALSVILFVYYGSLAFFNHRAQLIDHDLPGD